MYIHISTRWYWMFLLCSALQALIFHRHHHHRISIHLGSSRRTGNQSFSLLVPTRTLLTFIYISLWQVKVITDIDDEINQLVSMRIPGNWWYVFIVTPLSIITYSSIMILIHWYDVIMKGAVSGGLCHLLSQVTNQIAHIWYLKYITLHYCTCKYDKGLLDKAFPSLIDSGMFMSDTQTKYLVTLQSLYHLHQKIYRLVEKSMMPLTFR